MTQVVYRGGPRSAVQYLPGSNVNAGDVVVFTNMTLIADQDNPPNAQDPIRQMALYQGGIYEGPADGTIAVGNYVYWDATAKKFTLTASGNTAFGWLFTGPAFTADDGGPVTSGDLCRVRHDPQAVGSLTGALTVSSITGSASTLPIAGKAGSSSVGGAITVTGGAGNGSGNAGGAVTTTGGAAGSGNAAGGAVSMVGGVGAGSSAGGAAHVTGGASAASSSGNGGAVTLAGGALGSSGTGTGGAVTITGGAGASGGTAGSVTVDPGAANSGTAGTVTIGGTNACQVIIGSSSFLMLPQTAITTEGFIWYDASAHALKYRDNAGTKTVTAS